MRFFFVGLLAIVLALPVSHSALSAQEYQSYIDQINAASKKLKTFQTTTSTAKNSQIAALPVSVTSSAVRTLSRGMRGTDVLALQKFLISQNLISADSSTGYFGGRTEAAVKEFQRKNKIVSSGTPSTTGFGAVGPKTRSMIAKISNNLTDTAPSAMSSSSIPATVQGGSSATAGVTSPASAAGVPSQSSQTDISLATTPNQTPASTTPDTPPPPSAYIETQITKNEMCGESFLSVADKNVSNAYSDPLAESAMLPIIYNWDTNNSQVRAEKSQFGYRPAYTPGRVSFSRSGRPLIRDKQFNMQILSDSGTWKSINVLEIAQASLSARGVTWSPGTFGPIPHAAYADGGVSHESRVAFDNQCNGYTILYSSPTSLNANLLLHTPDGGHSWAAYPIPGSSGRSATTMELPSASYTLTQPPVLLNFFTNTQPSTPSPRTIVIPTVSNNTITFSAPVVVSNGSVSVSPAGGMENYAVSSGNNVFMVYPGAATMIDPVSGRRGTPAYIVTIDRTTKAVTGGPILLGVGVAPTDSVLTDDHNQPSISQDRLGYLHIVIGGHSGPIYYRKSQNPNDASSWTDIEQVGMVETGADEYTYPSLHVGYDLRPVIVARWSGDRYHNDLVSITRRSDGTWYQQVIVDPGRWGYAHWYHKLSFDPWGRIFLNYEYYPSNLYSDEAITFENTYPDVSMIPDPGCTPSTRAEGTRYCSYEESGYPSVNATVLMSPGIGIPFQLATTKTFFEF